jgi:lipopolysaccharide/colanic/teichoic acid biosynthesis glycosyltransferase
MTLNETTKPLVRPSSAVELDGRRMLDIVVAGTALCALSPLFLALSIIIAIESGTPIFFSQIRIGKNGRPFSIYKFRKFKASCDLNGYPLTLDRDERLTRVGRTLAASKLDELPQLWNIFRGDMSLVGPRPESITFNDCFHNGFEAILEHRPGLFGPCQVQFRHESRLYPSDGSAADFYREVLFPAKAKVDLAYFSRRTLVSDLRWIMRAIGVIAADVWASKRRRNQANGP